MDGDIIRVRSIFWPNSPIREVVYKNGGILVENHCFKWNYFFEVNEIVFDAKFTPSEADGAIISSK